MTNLSLTEWNVFLSKCPDAHLLQTAAWGKLKSSFGWEPVPMVSDEGGYIWGTQILFRRLPLGLTFGYLPKGPLLQNDATAGNLPIPGESFWKDVDLVCRRKRAVFLKFEPDDWRSIDQAHTVEMPPGFRSSPQAIQPPRTIVIDLRGSEEDILARMKQKTRYNIHLSAKKDVVVHPSANIEAFYRLMETTAERDQFGIHSLEYYQKAFELFKSADNCELLIAEYNGERLAGLMVFASGSRSWYLYGASASLHRDRMPTYLLQWEAMKWARLKGCSQYDLYGVPDHDAQVLETNFGDRSDGLWGIYRFKRGFGGEVTRSPGPWDRVYNAFLYQLYLRWMAKAAGGV